jgi:uncharacterized membrane protein
MKKVIDYFILLMMVLVQSRYVYIVGFTHRYLGNEIRNILFPFFLFIYSMSILHIREPKKFLVVNILWTIGFALLISEDIAKLSGTILIVFSCWLRNRILSVS